MGPRRAAMDDPDYAKTANDEILVCVQIETQQAVDHIDEILSVPGVDAVMIGPNDLSLSLGVFTQWESPKFKDAIGKIRGARASGTGLLPASSPSTMSRRGSRRGSGSSR